MRNVNYEITEVYETIHKAIKGAALPRNTTRSGDKMTPLSQQRHALGPVTLMNVEQLCPCG